MASIFELILSKAATAGNKDAQKAVREWERELKRQERLAKELAEEHKRLAEKALSGEKLTKEEEEKMKRLAENAR